MSLRELQGKAWVEAEFQNKPYLLPLFFSNKPYLKYEANVFLGLSVCLFVCLFASNRKATVAKNRQILGLHLILETEVRRIIKAERKWCPGSTTPFRLAGRTVLPRFQKVTN